METRKRRNRLLVPLLIILGLMVFMVLYTTRVIQDVAVSNIQEVGEDKKMKWVYPSSLLPSESFQDAQNLRRGIVSLGGGS